MRFTDSTAGITPEMLEGFFEGWRRVPAARKHLEILESSFAVVLAVDDERKQVVGFIAAISDGLLCAHITLLEVRPAYRRRGIGSELVRRMLDKLDKFYAISLTCDQELQNFYARFGMIPGTGMNIRNYDKL